MPKENEMINNAVELTTASHGLYRFDGLSMNYHAQPESSRAGKNNSAGNVLTLTTCDFDPSKEVIHRAYYGAYAIKHHNKVVGVKLSQYDMSMCLMDDMGSYDQGAPSNILQQRILLHSKS